MSSGTDMCTSLMTKGRETCLQTSKIPYKNINWLKVKKCMSKLQFDSSEELEQL